MLGFEICKLSLRLQTVLFMRIALPAAGLHWSLSAAPFPLPTLAALLQLRQGSRMLLSQRENCPSPWKSSGSTLGLAWLGISRSWNGSAAAPAGNSRALPSPVRSPLQVLWAGLYKMCYHPEQPWPSLSWGWERCTADWPHSCLQHWAPEKPCAGLWWSTTSWATQQMIPWAFTERGNGGTAKVPRSGFVPLGNAGGQQPAFLDESVGWTGPAPDLSLVFARIYKTRLTCSPAGRSQEEPSWEESKGDTALTQCHMLQHKQQTQGACHSVQEIVGQSPEGCMDTRRHPWIHPDIHGYSKTSISLTLSPWLSVT